VKSGFQKKPNPVGFIVFCRVFVSEWRLLKVKKIQPLKIAGFLVVRWKSVL